MSVIQVNDTGPQGSATSFTLSFGSLPAAGHSAIISVQLNGNATVSSITDNQSGNSYSRIAGLGVASGDNELWWCPVIVGSSGTYTATVNLSASAKYIGSIMEASALSGIVDQISTATGSPGGASPIGITMGAANVNANDLVIALMSGAYGYGSGSLGFQTPPGNNGVSGPFTSWSFYDTPNTAQMTVSLGYKLVSAIETSAAQWNFSTVSGDREQMVLVTLKGLATQVAGPTPRCLYIMP